MTNDFPRKGILIVVSGPSGSGKTTLCRNAREAHGLYYTVSCTTRSMRPGEMNGQDYHFLSMEDFQARVAQGAEQEEAACKLPVHRLSRSASVMSAPKAAAVAASASRNSGRLAGCPRSEASRLPSVSSMSSA